MAKRFHSIGDYLGWIHRVHTILERDELIAISGLASWVKEYHASISSGPLGNQSHTPAPVDVVDRECTP